LECPQLLPLSDGSRCGAQDYVVQTIFYLVLDKADKLPHST
jgi:hypothetical protein